MERNQIPYEICLREPISSNSFKENSALAVFLTVAIGFWIGKFRFGNFSLGIVTSVLLVGVVVGQMNIRDTGAGQDAFLSDVSILDRLLGRAPILQGAQKRRSPAGRLRGSRLRDVSALGMGLRDRHGLRRAAQAAGLLAGSQTMSAVIGAATDTIHELPGGRDTDLSVMPVCYAVTYIYGTAGSAWVLGTLGPRLLGGVAKVKQAAKQMESQMGDDMSLSPGFDPAARTIVFRAFSADNRVRRRAGADGTRVRAIHGRAAEEDVRRAPPTAGIGQGSLPENRHPPGRRKSSSAGAAGSSSKRKHGSDARSRTRNWSTSRSKRCRSSSIKKG